MKQLINSFLFAVSYFSIIPIFVKNLEVEEQTYKYTLFFLPLIGFILAFIVVGINLILINFFHPLYASLLAAILYFFYMDFYILKLYVM